MSRWWGVAVVALTLAASGAAVVPGARAAGETPKAPKAPKPPRKVEAFKVFEGGGAHLGVVLEEIEADDASRLKLSEERGAFVKEVVEGSPAEKAGLKADDVILSFQGDRVWSAAQLRRLVRETPPGRRVALEVSRGGSVQALTAQLDEARSRTFVGDGDFDFDLELPDIIRAPHAPLPPMPPLAPLRELEWNEREIERHAREAERHARDAARDAERNVRKMVLRVGGPRRLGVGYTVLTDQLAQHYGVKGGVLISEVETDGPAALAGLKAGDLVTRADGKEIGQGQDLAEVVAEAEPGSEIALTVRRDGRDLEVKAKLREPERQRPGLRDRRRGTI